LLSTSLGGTSASSFIEIFFTFLRLGGRLLVAVGNIAPFFFFFTTAPTFYDSP
jgi:hypothetical protein